MQEIGKMAEVAAAMGYRICCAIRLRICWIPPLLSEITCANLFFSRKRRMGSGRTQKSAMPPFSSDLDRSETSSLADELKWSKLPEIEEIGKLAQLGGSDGVVYA